MRSLVLMSTEQKTTTIRVSVITRDKIARYAHEEGRPMTEVLEEAIKDYEKKKFLKRLGEQMERTRREDPEGYAEYLAEFEIWQGKPSHRIAPEWEGLIDFPDWYDTSYLEGAGRKEEQGGK
ncbi:hypothetical protein GCM10009555_037080 [Acrocarpospora macrocephala]|uniref:Ribbon-helix-helix protein CopG domain-containing protein n=2 Tax=Acrocarpospora macrocephala TaxID=150177 RepID=A0A5M3WZE0_9ACTN|nr:hypothetical protein Amac_068660 [Acrocarpospora macrocephala]